jgi:uncharacterized protein (TIGR03083 family)
VGDPPEQPAIGSDWRVDLVRVLRGECEAVSGVVLDLDEGAFATATRCEGWHLKQLLGHMYRDIDRISVYLAAEAPPIATHDAASYFQVHHGGPDSAHARMVARLARGVADAYPSGRALADAWDREWRTVLDRAAATDRRRLVLTFAPALELGEYLQTRIVEITIHGLDLADALGQKPWATLSGLMITTGVLERMLGSRLPADLGWSTIQFAEIATGRRAIGPSDTETLGELAARFPLFT